MANTEPGAPLEAGIIPQKIRKLPIVPLLIISHFIATAAGRVTADDHAPQPTPITAPEIPDAGLDQAAELLSSESVAIILDAWNGKSFGKTPNADGGASVEN